MVMHARKPQRVNDGYFEKHQSHSYQSSKYSSKRDYERDRSSNYRDRDLSPSGGGGPLNNVSQRLSQTTMNNGNSASYRSQSPEIDSPSSRGHGSHDIRDRDHRGSDRFSYMQKMRDRDRDVYKKEKYSTGELLKEISIEICTRHTNLKGI
ncbi:PREDICTED: WW domain-containing adapter protein with coiled-coil-like isoform X2 [Rhagoletis zephyria]|uniref:WW domain-containing adapter protein with coiled-coil-like isoform X2 n=1 Tax=Rhagoletis zephyria TaxID=28612 RepID=UPI0008115432|nr:PREDICTED: WW domain-containing adapter protein with coiled-coil-like isoform X2 [Rhagoletis zephyria]